MPMLAILANTSTLFLDRLTFSFSVPIFDYINTLGITWDSNLTLNKHVSSVCKSAYYSIISGQYLHTWYGQSCRSILNTDPSWLRQLLLIRTSSSNIYTLQCIQNCLARVVLQDYSNSAASFL